MDRDKPRMYEEIMIERDHPQVNIHNLERGFFATVDEGMAGTIQQMWRLGIKTQFSCQNNLGLAYVVVDRRSAILLEKMLKLHHAELSSDSQYLAEVFLKVPRSYDFRYSYRSGPEDWWRSFSKRFGRKHTEDRSIFCVERTYQNAPHWFRTTYRWPHQWTPIVQQLLTEL